MKIKVNLKQVGKKRKAVKQEIYEIGDALETVQDLLVDIVSGEVEKYNEKVESPELLRYLTTEEIAHRKDGGKVDFGQGMNHKKQEKDKAIENALQSFEDGIFCLFINECQMEALDDSINLSLEDELTFVRLTMLAGRMW